MKIRELRAIIREDVGSDVYGSLVGRAKKLVLQKTAGCYADEFALLWTYAEEMRKANPGTTVKIQVDRGNPDNKPIFQRMYIGFASLRRGFLEGCRRVIGLDGCFLKGLCKGELLAAIGRDANDQMYPVAWAVVEVESKDSWSWFLELLGSDLLLENGVGWTLISDQQKGLIPAIADLLPMPEHRLCARHIFCNWRKKYKNPEWQHIFWECAKSPTVIKFNQAYKKLESINKQAAEDMVRVPKEQWCKAFFSTAVKCDSVDNNMSETFNASILEARHKPPYSLFDDIRRLTTERIVKKQQMAGKWKNEICPEIMKKYQTNAYESRMCRVITCGNQEYEVDHGEERYKVKIGQKSCTCRTWDLSGIPGPHAITCLVCEGKDPITFISEWYSIAKYNRTYSNTMPGMEGPRQWFPVDLEPIQPPTYRPMPGRPKKKRRLTADELLQKHKTRPNKLGRMGRIIICSKCKCECHNSRTCTLKEGSSSITSANASASGGTIRGQERGVGARATGASRGRRNGQVRRVGASRGRGRGRNDSNG
ncbi:unnamed protein product [Linum trigynum]|uniref:SWIM-type domain-containing protein n=1 Tax=Linum trigynum TaxID=586398 RepID=A0AAV2D992_9ROSI